MVIETIDHPTSHYPVVRSISRNKRRRVLAVKTVDRFRFLNFSARFPGIRSAAHARGGDEPIGTLEDAPAGKLKRRAVAATTQTRLEGTRTWAFVGVGCVFFARARDRKKSAVSACGDSLTRTRTNKKRCPQRVSFPTEVERSSLSKCVGQIITWVPSNFAV